MTSIRKYIQTADELAKALHDDKGVCCYDDEYGLICFFNRYGIIIERFTDYSGKGKTYEIINPTFHFKENTFFIFIDKEVKK